MAEGNAKSATRTASETRVSDGAPQLFDRRYAKAA
jgi:hypothetical protein